MVNIYLKTAGGGGFTAKHYRTWAGSVMAFTLLQDRPAGDEAQAARILVEVVKQVAGRLSNTPAVCRQCYIHPAILEAYRRGALPARQPPEAADRTSVVEGKHVTVRVNLGGGRKIK